MGEIIDGQFPVVYYFSMMYHSVTVTENANKKI